MGVRNSLRETWDGRGLEKLEEQPELFRFYSCLSEDSPECAGVQLRMIGNYNLGKRILPAKNDVTAVLSSNFKPRLLERANAFFARDARQ